MCVYLLCVSICTSMFHVYTDVWESQKRALDLFRWSYERLWAAYPGCRSEQQPALTLSHLSRLCISYWSSTLNLNSSLSLKVWSQKLGRDSRTIIHLCRKSKWSQELSHSLCCVSLKFSWKIQIWYLYPEWVDTTWIPTQYNLCLREASSSRPQEPLVSSTATYSF